MFKKNTSVLLVGCALIVAPPLLLSQVTSGVVASAVNPTQPSTAIPRQERDETGTLSKHTHRKSGSRVSRAEQARRLTIPASVCFRPGVGWTKNLSMDRASSPSFSVGQTGLGCGALATVRHSAMLSTGTNTPSNVRLFGLLSTELPSGGSGPQVDGTGPSGLRILQESGPKSDIMESLEASPGTPAAELLVPEYGEESIAPKLDHPINMNSFTVRQMVMESGNLETRLALDRASSYSGIRERRHGKSVQAPLSRAGQQSGMDNNSPSSTNSRPNNP